MRTFSYLYHSSKEFKKFLKNSNSRVVIFGGGTWEKLLDNPFDDFNKLTKYFKPFVSSSSWIDTLKEVVEKEVSDEQMKNAHFRFPIQTPLNKEEFYYRTIFESHFPSEAAALCVPQEASVACSTKIALEWDEAFKNMNDPSGRAVAKVHDKAY